MISDFILYAALAGTGIALIAGPIGSIMVWKRMAFFGDALSHSALLGVALALFLHIHASIGIVCATLLFSVILALSQRQRSYSSDTMLGILAHGTLAFGLVTIALLDLRIDLYSFLFGDILSVSLHDLIIIYGISATALALLYYFWKPLILSTIHHDLAQAEGVNTHLLNGLFMAIIAVIVALSVKIVGVLLVTSLLIIPAASARFFATTPERMAVTASLIGILSVIGGIYASMQWDIPTGPAIVVTATFIFIGTSIVQHFKSA